MKTWTPLVLSFAAALLLLGAGPQAEPAHSGTYGQYAVASDQGLASMAGAELLAAGGNAADAAAATMLALGVVNPASSGLGGGGFALYYRAEDQSLTFLDFRERAPAAASRMMFADEGSQVPRGSTKKGPLGSRSQLGGLASGVPGEAAGIEALLKRFGTKSMKEVVAPALELAEGGFAVSEAVFAMGEGFAAQLAEDPVMSRWDLRPDGTLRRPALAEVLRALGREGARAIYQGPIAEQIVSSVQAHGGIMTVQDLADYRVVTRKPLQGRHFGFLWATAPPPSAGGFTMLQSLAMLERTLGPSPSYGVDFLHALAESWKGPFLDRERYFGDPDQVILPLQAMMSTARLEKRVHGFSTEEAMPSTVYDVPLSSTEPSLRAPDNAGTSHLCVVDAQGNVAAVTTTVNLPFGARYTAGGLVMNDEMDDFTSDPGKPNAFGLVGGARNLPGPRKRPVSTMSPTIVFQDGKPVLCIGASGGSRIVTATEQVALRILLLGEDAAETIAAPRIHHQAQPAELRVEKIAPLDDALQQELRARGHEIDPIHNVATVQLIYIDRSEAKQLRAASDPRKGGAPAGR